MTVSCFPCYENLSHQQTNEHDTSKESVIVFVEHKKIIQSFNWMMVEEGGFARLRAGRSAALTRHRRVIQYRSPSSPLS